MGAPKSPYNVTYTSFETAHLLPKDLGFEHGGANLLRAPSNLVTSLVVGQTYKTSTLSSSTPAPTLLKNSLDPVNLLRTGVGRFRSCLIKLGMASSAARECGVEERTVDHVVFQCPIHPVA